MSGKARGPQSRAAQVLSPVTLWAGERAYPWECRRQRGRRVGNNAVAVVQRCRCEEPTAAVFRLAEGTHGFKAYCGVEHGAGQTLSGFFLLLHFSALPKPAVAAYEAGRGESQCRRAPPPLAV